MSVIIKLLTGILIHCTLRKKRDLLSDALKHPVDIFWTAVGESPDYLLLSWTLVGKNPDHVCWAVHFLDLVIFCWVCRVNRGATKLGPLPKDMSPVVCIAERDV